MSRIISNGYDSVHDMDTEMDNDIGEMGGDPVLPFEILGSPDRTQIARDVGGSNYYCIGLADGRTCAIWCEEIVIDDGHLKAYALRIDDDSDGIASCRVPVLALALRPGAWTHVYAGNPDNDTPLIVDHLLDDLDNEGNEE